MQRRKFLKIGLGIGLTLGITGILRQSIVRSESSPEAILDDLATARIIYLGERHDNPDDHRAQALIVQSLYHRNPQLAIAFEMFQRPYQALLNNYLAGHLQESELRQKSEYDDRWGYDWGFYAPILRFAKDKQLPLLALNTPTEITRKVARQGLGALDERDRQWIPPLSEIQTDDPPYRAYLLPFFEQHGGQGNSSEFVRFVEAQVLWDETMAEAIAQFAQQYPQKQIVVLVGKGHILYGYGTPSRVQRRLGKVKQRSLIFAEVTEQGYRLTDTRSDRLPPADYVWRF